MTRVLVTGGSGFIAAHILEVLLQRGHSVVATVRSEEKGQKILASHPSANKAQLDYAIVPDISQPGGMLQIRDCKFNVIDRSLSL